MNNKLTLSIEQNVIDSAKKFAKNHNQSLSEIIENFLKATIEIQSPDKIELTPIVNKLKGSYHIEPDESYEEILVQSLNQKYMQNEKSTN